MIRTVTAAFALAGALTLHAADEPTEINFGIISTEASANLKSDWEPLRADLEKALGLPVKTFFAPDYSGVIEAMRFNKVQLGWFGNKSAIDVVDRANGEVFCQVIDKDGNPGYWSLIVVHQDSPITSLEQLLAKGKELTFSNGDPQSTSGNLVPGYYAFAKNGVDPTKHFKRCINGNHETNALAVAAKQVDAATFNTEAMFRLEANHPEKAKMIRAIWKGPLIASDPMCYRKDLPAGLKAKIRTFFLEYGTSEDQKAKIAALKWSGFRASDDNQLLPFRQLGLLKDKAKIEADEKLSADDKKAKLADIEARLADLGARMSALAVAQ